jgi:hypothetical protein
MKCSATQDAVTDKLLYQKLPHEKLKINWNKNPIKMELFLSFLAVPVTRSYDHLGNCNGWTLLTNEERRLYIGGGFVNGVEYLDSIKYGVKLQNQYNNYVNPFYCFELFNADGKKFFVEYYKEDIDQLIAEAESKIEQLKMDMESAEFKLKAILTEISLLTS